jgi:hypothetical protein
MSANAWFKSFTITGAAGDKTIVKFTANRGEVAPATAATDKIAGVLALAATAVGEVVDVAMGGVHEVVAGGAIAAGDPLTTDANGAAVPAAFAAGAARHVIGKALVPAVAGDIFPYLVAPSVIAG